MLKEYTIGVEALGKSCSFNPQLDTVVRVEMNRLRSRLASYYSEEGKEDQMRIGIPLGKYLLEITDKENLSIKDFQTIEYTASFFLGEPFIELHLNMQALDSFVPYRHELIKNFMVNKCQNLDFCRTTLLNPGVDSDESYSYPVDCNGKHTVFTILVSSYLTGNLETLFISIIDMDRNQIIFSTRQTVDHLRWDIFEYKLDKVFSEVKALIHPLSPFCCKNYYRNQ